MAKATATAKTTDPATGYCMKCKTTREITNAKPITMKNGRPATEGTCPVCSTKMFTIGSTK
jgi:hypothetical protein